MSRIFINYRRQDSEGYVGRLYDHLAKHFEQSDIFMDVDSIKPGADFVQTLEDAVAGCDVFIAMIGPQWLTLTDSSGARRLDQWNDFVRIEIASALKQNKLVIPVLVGQARMPQPSDLPEDLAILSRRNAIELSHQRFTYDIERLIQTIKDSTSTLRRTSKKTPTELVQQKEDAIKDLRIKLVGATESPLYKFRVENRLFPVLGEGYADANIVFIGEAPGKTETETGKPFCGPSGDILDEMLKQIGLKREDVYVTNLLMDRPPEKRSPTLDEIGFYTPFVNSLLDIIRPSVIVTLGRFATEYLLKKMDLPEKREKISNLHGKLIKTQADYGDLHIVPLYHPAVVLYSASQKETLRKDFEKLRLFI